MASVNFLASLESVENILTKCVKAENFPERPGAIQDAIEDLRARCIATIKRMHDLAKDKASGPSGNCVGTRPLPQDKPASASQTVRRMAQDNCPISEESKREAQERAKSLADAKDKEREAELERQREAGRARKAEQEAAAKKAKEAKEKAAADKLKAEQEAFEQAQAKFRLMRPDAEMPKTMRGILSAIEKAEQWDACAEKYCERFNVQPEECPATIATMEKHLKDGKRPQKKSAVAREKKANQFEEYRAKTDAVLSGMADMLAKLTAKLAG